MQDMALLNQRIVLSVAVERAGRKEGIAHAVLHGPANREDTDGL